MENSDTKPARVKGSEIFVGGLLQSTKEETLRDAFQKFGEIVEVRLMKDQKGNLKGYAFVRFTTKEAAQAALKEKDGAMLQGKRVRVSPSTDQDRVFIGSLKREWTHEDIDRMVRQAFKDVVDVELPVVPEGASDSKKRLNRGFGFITFKDHSAAARAHRMGNKPDFTMDGSWHVIIDWAQHDTDFDPDEMAKVTVAFVSNLPSNVNESFLRKHFEPFGKLERVSISKKAGIPVGFVHFCNRSDLETAIKELDGKTVDGVDGVDKGQSVKLQVTISKPIHGSKKRSREDMEYTAANKGGTHKKIDTSGTYSGPHLIVNPYELSVLGLLPNVIEKLLQIFRRGIAKQDELDLNVLEDLRELPESTAMDVLEKFAAANLSDVRNKGGYLASLIRKQGRRDAGRSVKGSKKASDVGATPRVSGLDAYKPRQIPSDSEHLRYGGGYSSLSSLGTYGDLTSRLTDTALLSRLPTTGLGDVRGIASYGLSSASSLGYGGVGSLSGLSSLSGYGGGALSGLGSLGAGREVEHRPFKFDPFTGEPYKFDPFTGEPLQPSGASSTRIGNRYL